MIDPSTCMQIVQNAYNLFWVMPHSSTRYKVLIYELLYFTEGKPVHFGSDWIPELQNGCCEEEPRSLQGNQNTSPLLNGKLNLIKSFTFNSFIYTYFCTFSGKKNTFYFIIIKYFINWHTTEYIKQKLFLSFWII